MRLVLLSCLVTFAATAILARQTAPPMTFIRAKSDRPSNHGGAAA